MKGLREWWSPKGPVGGLKIDAGIQCDQKGILSASPYLFAPLRALFTLL